MPGLFRQAAYATDRSCPADIPKRCIDDAVCMAAPDLNLTTKEPFLRGSHPCMARYNGEGYPGAACRGQRMGDTIPASRRIS